MAGCPHEHLALSVWEWASIVQQTAWTEGLNGQLLGLQQHGSPPSTQGRPPSTNSPNEQNAPVKQWPPINRGPPSLTKGSRCREAGVTQPLPVLGTTTSSCTSCAASPPVQGLSTSTYQAPPPLPCMYCPRPLLTSAAFTGVGVPGVGRR